MTEQNTSPEMDALKAQMGQVRKELKELAGQLGKAGKVTCGKLSARAATASKTAMHQSSEMADKARTKASAVSVKAEEFVKERPATAVGIAAITGVVAGVLLRRR